MPAEADGAVHITPAAKAAPAAPTVAIHTLVFMLGFHFSGRRRHFAAAGYSGDSICSTALARAARFFSNPGPAARLGGQPGPAAPAGDGGPSQAAARNMTDEHSARRELVAGGAVLRWPHHPAVVGPAHEFADCGHAIKSRAGMARE